MAANTYVALDETTVGTAVPSVTFTGISGAYTDLVLVVSARSTYAAAEVAGFIRLGNGSIDTGSNYSRTRLLGTGSAASSARASNLTATPWDAIPGSTSASGNFCTTIISIQNYSNTTTYKTFLIRANEPNNYVEAEVGLWRGMSAINQVQIYGDGGGDLAVGSTFSLYGIKAWSDESTPKAIGGYVSSDSTYWYHAFPHSGTFTPNQSLTADLLVVAGGGGGGGGGNGGGGGGAGGFRELLSQSLTAVSYTINIGAGGAGGYAQKGISGSNSSIAGSGFTTLTRSGGGGGGLCSGVNKDGVAGGSGGGAGATSGSSGAVGAGNAGSYTPVEGFAGGLGSSDGVTYDAAGGGGGAGAVGSAATSSSNGAGGIGVTSSLINEMGTATGLGQLVSSNYYFAGGGGGGSYFKTPGSGGFGGGGIGANTAGANVGNGLSATGSGGGGNSIGGASGGSGIVIVRYLKA